MTIQIFDLVIGRKDDLNKTSVPKPVISKTITYNIPIGVIKDKLKISGDILSFDVDKKTSEIKIEIIKKM